MLSLPKQLRHLLRDDRRTVTSVLAIFLPVIEQVLRRANSRCSTAPKTQLELICRFTPVSV
ncbi:MAG: hypothetical protein GY807_02270 [Gammaproteobacteria bacterium]|nr:hypothetical protein [Gammaproteobacteria bacterium]